MQRLRLQACEGRTEYSTLVKFPTDALEAVEHILFRQ